MEYKSKKATKAWNNRLEKLLQSLSAAQYTKLVLNLLKTKLNIVAT